MRGACWTPGTRACSPTGWTASAGGVEVFVATYAPRPRMLVFGATDHAAAVAATGSFLGYHVTVGDARPVFATASRSPAAAEVVVDRQGHGAQPLRLVDGPIQGGPAHGAADVHGS